MYSAITEPNFVAITKDNFFMYGLSEESFNVLNKRRIYIMGVYVHNFPLIFHTLEENEDIIDFVKASTETYYEIIELNKKIN